MVTHRSAKTKGKQFEYNVEASLKQKFSDISMTHLQGFVQGFDLISKEYAIVVECKNMKSMSWNQMKKYFETLKERAPQRFKCFLIVKSNHQPVLVMQTTVNGIVVTEFEDYFGVPFIKHEPVRMIKNATT